MATRVPKHGHTVTPYLKVPDIARVTEFLKDTFGATELFNTRDDDGTINHAEVTIGNCKVMLGADAQPAPCTLFVSDDDVDGTFARAIESGGVAVSVPADQPWGGRCGTVRCPGGHHWSIVWPIQNTE
jgi:PhnB protein